jgi:hypothetical protein
MLRRIAVLLAVLATMMVMSVPPVMANHDVGHTNQSERGNKSDDGTDANKGGGQEHIRNPRPPRGGANHSDNGGGNDGCISC